MEKICILLVAIAVLAKINATPSNDTEAAESPESVADSVDTANVTNAKNSTPAAEPTTKPAKHTVVSDHGGHKAHKPNNSNPTLAVPAELLARLLRMGNTLVKAGEDTKNTLLDYLPKGLLLT